MEEVTDTAGASELETKYEQPLASLLASQTAENTEYNRYFKCFLPAKRFLGNFLGASKVKFC